MPGSGITWVDRERVLGGLRRAAGVLRERGALEVWLFGSWAWGTPTPASDVDILVVAQAPPRNPIQRRRLFGEPLVEVGVALDLVVLSPEEAQGNPLYRLAKGGIRLA